MNLFFSFLFLVSTHLSNNSCVGKWETMDDETGKKKSIVELYKIDGKLYGKVVHIYPREGLKPNPSCKKCTDDRKNKPIIGMQIVRGLQWNGTEWENGTVLDPENGKVYTASIWLDSDNPNKLNLRGYVGIFYRTQQWVRKTN